MNSLDIINRLYKPYRIIKKSKCTIIESMDGTFVMKPKNSKDLKEEFKYLDSRGFYYHPKIVDDSRNDFTLLEYIEDTDYPSEQKCVDMASIIASLHSKTSYIKDVTEDKYKEIYDNIKSNLTYYRDLYLKYTTQIEEEIFMSPSHYLFIRASSKLINQIKFCENELDKWYELVKNKKEYRISTIHNNLSLAHFCKSDKSALISWDNITKDSPILDIYKFYLNDGDKLNFKKILETYLKESPLDEDELKLLLILLALPKEITFSKDELSSCKELSKYLDNIYKTEELIRPYYLVDDKIKEE